MRCFELSLVLDAMPLPILVPQAIPFPFGRRVLVYIPSFAEASQLQNLLPAAPNFCGYCHAWQPGTAGAPHLRAEPHYLRQLGQRLPADAL